MVIPFYSIIQYTEGEKNFVLIGPLHLAEQFNHPDIAKLLRHWPK